MIRTVLLVDDDDDIRTIARIALARLGGWETLLAGSGPEALRIATEKVPDLIVLDVMMPHMDGPAVLAALRADPRTARVPVVFLTARVRRGDAGHFAALGALGAIAKPFDPTRLPAELMRLVEGAT
jgi:CheY-like chemotaxis protein